MTVEAIPGPGELQRFIGFSGACTGPDRSCTVVMDGAKVITASFCAAIR